MKASDAVLTREKTIKSEVNPVFFRTVPSRRMDWVMVPVYREGTVSSKRREPAIEMMPMRQSTQKRPRHEV